ncbi:MAG: carboxypeptidase regulatory-like domain-containing protein, partial [Myxococcales bacterium]|nr:carboxypeptidase regulatory-like domain-containing protein [Myxococcales bacterium]
MNERLALLLSLALGLLAAGVIAWLGSSSSEPSVDESREVASQDLVLAPRADVEDGATGPGLEGRAPEQLPGAVQGLVIDAETELPLAGVSVMAVPLWEHGESARGVTDAEGRYEVRVPHGAYDLTTWLPGYVSAGLAESARGRRESPLIVHVVEDAPRAEAPTIRLRRGLSLRVRVVEGATNEPVPHASVRFRGTGTRVLRWAAPSQLSEPPAEASYSAELPTDAHGELSLTVLPSPLADWSLGAVAPGRISAWQALGPEGPWDVELRLVQGARLAGRVVDTSGAGVPDVSIEPEPLDEAFESVWILPSLPTVTSREGAFVIEPVAPGSCRLVARFLDPEARAGGVQVLDLKAGEVRAGIEIVVPTRHVLRGTLVDGTGSPVRDGPLRVRVTTAHENVHISLGFGRSDTRGRVALPLPHTGPWTVELSTPLGWYELAAGVKLPSQELTLRAPTEVVTSFSLQVGEADGTPIDWFRVSAFSLAGDSHRARMEHSFVASSDGPEMHIDVPGPLPLAVAVSAQVGDTLDRRTMLLLLRELPADGVVRVRWSNSTGLAGVVRSEDGSPLPDTMVRVSSAESGRGAHRKDTQTDAQGAFLLPYSPEMDIVTRVEVIPPSPWLAPSPVVHDFTTGPLEVVVQRGATLVGRFETPEPVRFDPEDQIQVRWLVGDTQLELGRGAWARVEPDGRFAVHGLPSDRDLVWSYVG